MFAPVILGSDKTTISVATSQNDFYPLYLSLGNVHHSVRRAHRNAVSLLGFLAIPKGKCISVKSAFPTVDLRPWRSFKGLLRQSRLPKVSPTAIPYITRTHPLFASQTHDGSAHHPLCRWALPTCHLRARSIHCRLPRASVTCMYCAELVSEVRSIALNSSGTNSFNQGALPRLTILTEEMVFLVLMSTQTHFYGLEQLDCGNSGTAMGL